MSLTPEEEFAVEQGVDDLAQTLYTTLHGQDAGVALGALLNTVAMVFCPMAHIPGVMESVAGSLRKMADALENGGDEPAQLH